MSMILLDVGMHKNNDDLYELHWSASWLGCGLASIGTTNKYDLIIIIIIM